MLKHIMTIFLLMMLARVHSLTGFGVTGPVSLDNVDPSLILVSPNGGESWPAGSGQNISWQASDNHFGTTPIGLYYSLNGGDYVTIDPALINDGSEHWDLPNTESNMALVRINATDTFGNSSIRTSAGYFVISAPVPQPPGGVCVDLSNNVDAILTWLPVTQNVDGSPFVPDGYIVLYSEDPGLSPSNFFFLGETSSLTYTHYRVVLFRQQMFYNVVAYSDWDGRIRTAVSDWMENPETIHTLNDLLDIVFRTKGVTR